MDADDQFKRSSGIFIWKFMATVKIVREVTVLDCDSIGADLLDAFNYFETLGVDITKYQIKRNNL